MNSLRKFVFSPRWSGPLLTLGLSLIMCALLRYNPLTVVSPLAPLMLAVIYATFRGGTFSGLLSATLTCSYLAFYFYSTHEFEREFPLAMARLVSWAISSPIMVILVGRLKRMEVVRFLAEEKAEAAILRNMVTETALRETTRTMEMLVNSSPVGILVLDPKYKVTLWNPACERIFGWSEVEALQSFPKFIAPKNIPFFLKRMDDLKATRRKVYLERDAIRKDGVTVRASFAAIPLIDDRNSLYGFMVVMSDITERTRTEEQLRAAREQAERKNEEIHKANIALSQATRVKSQFLANMSHEIRTPINGVIGMCQILMDTALTEEQTQIGKTIQQCADTLLRLINDILDVSKIEAGKLTLEHIEFEPEQALHYVVAMQKVNAEKKGLAFEYSIDSDCPRKFQGDPTRIKQILLNLVDNAVKFTPEGSVSVFLSYDRAEGLRFEVRDTGIGIAPDARENVFEPFLQADSSTTRKYGGTGLGLSICKNLVSLMGGRIGVHNNEGGKGTTFWFTLPLLSRITDNRKSTIAALESRVQNGLSPPSVPRLKILLAEDNAINKLITVTMLEKMGHDVQSVTNGNEAIRELASQRFDLVLMDCQMPELDGFQTTQKIRSDHKETGELNRNIPIIAMTANAMKGDREKCLAIGMSDYVSKPMTSEDLAQVIARVIVQFS